MKDTIKSLLFNEIQRLFIEEKEEKDNIRNFPFILSKYPYLLTILNQYKVKIKDWDSVVREAFFFENNDIRYMYDRTMQIVRRFKEAFGEYFEIKNQLGTYLIPDRLSDFNRLFELYEEFFYIIYPRIVNKINLQSFNAEKNSNLLFGKINWNKTVVKNFLGDESIFPINFTTLVSESSIHNPENVLFLSYLIRIGTDSRILQEYNFHDSLNYEEKSILENIIDGCNKLINNNMILQPILQHAIEYANLTIYDIQLINLESTVFRRINDGIIRQEGYTLLINWITKYRQLNIRIISPNHTNFPIHNVKNLDTMFELWILFEILDFLFLYYSATITKVSSINDPKIKFKIQIHHIEFLLCYQENYYGWARISTPDYTIEVNGQLRIIMDAKNWADRKDEAIYKMQGYLNNLDCDLGVLFFPNSKDIDNPEYKGINLKKHLNQSIINCVIPLSGIDKVEQKKNQLQKLFQDIFIYLNKDNTL